MKKRGQATYLVALGILILVIIGGIVYTNYRMEQKSLVEEISYPPQIQEVRDSLKNCIEDLVNPGLLLLGQQGGFIIPPDNAITVGTTPVAYAYYEGRNTFISKQKMEQEFATYMNLFVPSCTEDITKFSITPKTSTTTVQIEDESIGIQINFPVTVKAGSLVYEIKEPYFIQKQVPLGRLHSVISIIVEKAVQDPDNLDLNYLLDTGFNSEIYYQTDNDLLYIISDPLTPVLDVDYRFVFATRFK